MAPSRSPLNRQSIVEAMTELLGPLAVETGDEQLKAASVDRFRKYTSVHGIYDGPIPAAIVYPSSTEDVAAILRFAAENLVNLVPRTGQTATEGGLETVVEDSLVVDGSRMNAILSIDPADMMATTQCGVGLQELEDTLRAQGLTTGHSPQSKPLAQMGGLVATRSIGQFSTLYGGIEDMVVGLESVFPDGTVTRVKNVPRRAAGPDIRHVVIGSEGALCFITEVTVKLFRYQPENNRYFGFLVDTFADGIAAIRELITAGYRPSVCRVYSPEDARQHFAGFYQGKNVVVLVAEGPKGIADATAEAIEELLAARPHERVDGGLIRRWFEDLNWGQDKIDAEKADMLSRAHLGFTTEISVGWSRVSELFDAVMSRIRSEFPRAGDLTMLGAHSSHSYQTGTNLYFVYDYTIRCSPREEIEVYHKPLNAIIVTEALRVGGSMVHHHGIGKYRTPWVRQEHGSAYYLLSTLKHAFDPEGVMNAGTIFPLEPEAGRARSRELTMTPYLLAIDNGSQSTKVTIFDSRGHPVVSARRRLKPYDTSVPGHASHPGDDIWDSIRDACRAAMARFAGDPAGIVAIGLCTIRFCRALLAADGSLAEPVLSWMDERVSRPYEPGNPLVRYVTTSSGYITHRLTGQFTDAAANYQGVWPIDQDTAAWSGEPAAYAAAGMARDMLFDLVPPGGRLGEVTPAAAEATGIPAGLPVYATANDKAVEALGSGLKEDGAVLLSLGTYIAAMTIGSSSRSAGDSYWANFAARPGKYLYESTGIRRGMWTVSWYRTVLEGSYAQEPPAGAARLEDTLNAEASELAPGSNGLLTLPDWLAPGHAAWRRGALLGFDGSQGRAHIYRSILEGIALTMANHTAAMEQALGRRLSPVLVSGGGSSSDLMMQILAHVFDRPARRTAVNDAAGLGAAICAAVGHGVYPDWDQATAAMVAAGDEFAPDTRAARAYQKINTVYAALTSFTDPLFRSMADGLQGLERA